MNRIALFGTLVLATAATSAFAGTTYLGDIAVESTPFVSTRAKTDVQTELTQYKQSRVNPWSTSYNPLKYFHSTKARAQVEQEYLASRDEVRALTAEDSGSSYLAQHRVRDTGSKFAGKAAQQQQQ